MYPQYFSIIDIIIVLGVIAFGVIGWKKGFLLTIIKMASSVFGLIASLLLSKSFAKVLDGWFGASIDTKIYDYMMSRSDLFNSSLSIDNVRTALEGMSMPTFLIDWIIGKIDFSQIGVSIVDAIEPTIKSIVMVVLAFIILFFGSMLVFLILKMIAKLITSIPFIKQVDKVFGVIFGLFKMAIVTYVLLFLLALLMAVPAVNKLIGDFVTSDMQLSTDAFRISKWLYNNNVIQDFIGIFF